MPLSSVEESMNFWASDPLGVYNVIAVPLAVEAPLTSRTQLPSADCR